MSARLGHWQAVVIVASTRAATGVYEDRTGPVIVAWLRERGWNVEDPIVVPDGRAVADALGTSVAARPALIITTGGTGISPTDTTPEATQPLLQREIPGFMEELRRRGAAVTPTAILTRGHAGIAGSSFVVNLPGSTGGVRDGLDVLDGILDHVLDQLSGGHAGHGR
ncbi:MAG: MogA/MoaB family molybdenum cofactor biosynthesis protein [Microbacteriaceae bacterium]|nr:MAG: MogA/MoaB family molybdenum cofactor biosynthesis protein [Microbacteriaceae bacterium]